MFTSKNTGGYAVKSAEQCSCSTRVRRKRRWSVLQSWLPIKKYWTINAGELC